MAIVFHCEHCGREIKAADSAGGKWGKCPSCHNKCYVPSIDSEDEELKLAPLDNNDLEREKQLMAETYRLQQDILREREVPEGGYAAPAGAIYDMDEKELRKNVVKCLRQLSGGDLNDAEATAALMSRYKKEVIEIIDEIAVSEIPEQGLSDISPQVLAGFLRTMRSMIT